MLGPEFRAVDMRHFLCSKWATVCLLLCCTYVSAQPPLSRAAVLFIVVDENGLAIPAAQLTIQEPGRDEVRLWTDYAGHCTYIPQQDGPYQLRAEKPGFYRAEVSALDAYQRYVRVVLTHEQIVR